MKRNEQDIATRGSLRSRAFLTNREALLRKGDVLDGYEGRLAALALSKARRSLEQDPIGLRHVVGQRLDDMLPLSRPVFGALRRRELSEYVSRQGFLADMWILVDERDYKLRRRCGEDVRKANLRFTEGEGESEPSLTLLSKRLCKVREGNGRESGRDLHSRYSSRSTTSH